MSDDTTSPATVGRQLARRRADLDLTQDQLADRIGVRARTISAIERGTNSIQRSNRSAWERALALKTGTISRAYNEGTAIEPAGAGRDEVQVEEEPKPSLSEVIDRMTALAEEVKELRRRDEEREREHADELERWRRRQSS